MDLVDLLERPETDDAIKSIIARLKSARQLSASVQLERKDYLSPPPATSYRSLKQAGISLQLERPEGRAAGVEQGWEVAAVDIYNAEALDEGVVDPRAKSEWEDFPLLPLDLDVVVMAAAAEAEKEAAKEQSSREPRNVSLSITKDTRASELVKHLGEPTRKGGGETGAGGGASGFGPAAWLEWEVQAGRGNEDGTGKGKKFKLMVELAGKDARGAGRWEADKAGKARWGVLTLSVA